MHGVQICITSKFTVCVPLIREEEANCSILFLRAHFFAFITNPFDLAAILPLALLLNAFFTDVGADSVLFSGLPFADVLPPVSPNECAMSLALIVYEVTLVHFSVFPFKLALTIHFVFSPIACVGFAIRPVIMSETADFICLELTLVVASICES